MNRPALALFALVFSVAAVPALVVAQACSDGACQSGVARTKEPAAAAAGGTTVDAYYSTTVAAPGNSIAAANATTTIAAMTVPSGTYAIQLTSEIAVGGEAGTITLDRIKILADGSPVSALQTLTIVNRGADLALTAVATTTTGALSVTVRNTHASLTGSVNSVNFVATRVASLTIL